MTTLYSVTDEKVINVMLEQVPWEGHPLNIFAKKVWSGLKVTVKEVESAVRCLEFCIRDSTEHERHQIETVMNYLDDLLCESNL